MPAQSLEQSRRLHTPCSLGGKELLFIVIVRIVRYQPADRSVRAPLLFRDLNFEGDAVTAPLRHRSPPWLQPCDFRLVKDKRVIKGEVEKRVRDSDAGLTPHLNIKEKIRSS